MRRRSFQSERRASNNLLHIFTSSLTIPHIRYRARFRPSVKQEFEESELDKDIDSIIDGNSSAMNEVSYDSIMGPDSDEEEEDEVSGLLAED